MRLYKEKKQKEKEKKELIEKINQGIEFDNTKVEQNKVDVDDQKKEPQNKDYSSPDTDDHTDSEHESDDSLLGDDEEEDELLIQKPPYFYIDYDEGNIQLAKNSEYETLLVKRNEGLTPELIKKFSPINFLNLKKNIL